MSRASQKVSMAPLAITSDGTLIINLTQFQNDVRAEALVARAVASGLPVFVGIVVPPAVQRASAKIIDDAAAEVAGRIGAKLTAVVAASASDPEEADEGQARRGRPSARRRRPRSRPGRPS